MVIKVLDIGLEIPAIIYPIVVIRIVFMMMNVLECLWVMGDVDRGLKRQATLPPSIV